VCGRLVVRWSTTPCHTRRDHVIDSDSLAESTARMLSESTWSLRMDGWMDRSLLDDWHCRLNDMGAGLAYWHYSVIQSVC